MQAKDQFDTSSKKRNHEYISANELQWKLQSKQDFYVYLDKHRKSLISISLTLQQSSITFPQNSM